MNKSPRRRRALTAAWLLAGSIVTAPAFAADPPADNSTSLAEQNRQLAQQIRELEKRVQDLETHQPAPASDTGSVTSAVQADAAHRSEVNPLGSLNGGYAPSAGFVIRSADGQFSLHPALTLDFRYMANYRQDTPAGGGGETAKTGNDLQSGFDLSRLRLMFDGTLTSNIGYFIQFQDDQGTSFGILDAYATYHFSETPFTLKAGQFKDPVWHERNISEAKQIAVDRSLIETLLGGGQGSRVQGLCLLYDQDRLRGQVVLHDGFNSSNTKFFDSGGVAAGVGGAAGVSPDDFGVSGRAEFLALGNRSKDFNPFTEYDQFTSLDAKQDIVVLGGGFDYTQAGSNWVILHSVDAQYNGTNGLGLYAAYLGSIRDLSTNEGVAPGSYYDPGFLLQASYLINPKLEPFVRYDYTYLAGGSVTGVNTHRAQEITVGANYYVYHQNAKFTVDASWLPDGSPTDSDALGILKNSGQNEFIVRAQFQLAI